MLERIPWLIDQITNEYKPWDQNVESTEVYSISMKNDDDTMCHKFSLQWSESKSWDGDTLAMVLCSDAKIGKA